MFINNNRRHQKEFNRLKSSKAMKTLLKADEAAEKRKKMVHSGNQIISKMDFATRRSGAVY